VLAKVPDLAEGPVRVPSLRAAAVATTLTNDKGAEVPHHAA
jgi:hypothetical protein